MQITKMDSVTVQGKDFLTACLWLSPYNTQKESPIHAAPEVFKNRKNAFTRHFELIILTTSFSISSVFKMSSFSFKCGLDLNICPIN